MWFVIDQHQVLLLNQDDTLIINAIIHFIEGVIYYLQILPLHHSKLLF